MGTTALVEFGCSATPLSPGNAVSMRRISRSKSSGREPFSLRLDVVRRAGGRDRNGCSERVGRGPFSGARPHPLAASSRYGAPTRAPHGYGPRHLSGNRIITGRLRSRWVPCAVCRAGVHDVLVSGWVKRNAEELRHANVRDAETPAHGRSSNKRHSPPFPRATMLGAASQGLPRGQHPEARRGWVSWSPEPGFFSGTNLHVQAPSRAGVRCRIAGLRR
jgi:hypothetical protein